MILFKPRSFPFTQALLLIFCFFFHFVFFSVTKKKTTTKSPVTKRHFGRVLNISFERIGEGYCIWMWVTKAFKNLNF